MLPHEYYADAIWANLSQERSIAHQLFRDAMTEATKKGFKEGTKELVELAAKNLNLAQDAIFEREKLISRSEWGAISGGPDDPQSASL